MDSQSTSSTKKRKNTALSSTTISTKPKSTKPKSAKPKSTRTRKNTSLSATATSTTTATNTTATNTTATTTTATTTTATTTTTTKPTVCVFRKLPKDKSLVDATDTRVETCNYFNIDEYGRFMCEGLYGLFSKDAMELSTRNFEKVKQELSTRIHIFNLEKKAEDGKSNEPPANYNLIGIKENPRVVFQFPNDDHKIVFLFRTGYCFSEVVDVKGKKEANSPSEYAYVVWKQIDVYFPKDLFFEIPDKLLDFLGKFLQVDDVPVVYLQNVSNKALNNVRLDTLTVTQLSGLVDSTKSITIESSCEKNNLILIKPMLETHLVGDLANIVCNYVA